MHLQEESVLFVCGECDKEIEVVGAIIDADGRIYLIGPCPDCKVRCRIDIESVISGLAQVHKRRGN